MVKWLGFLPAPMHGLIAVQRDKLLRAIQVIQEVLAGSLTVDRYRSLMGFLEHLKLLVDRPKARTAHLYRPLQSGQEIDSGPATLVRVDQLMRDSFTEWLTVLSSTAIAPVSYALPRARRTPVTGMCFFFSSDAAKEGTPTPALAGYMHGMYWQLFFPPEWHALHITLLEFLALAMSVIIFAPYLEKVPSVVIETDSLSASFVLSEASARSPPLYLAHSLLLDTPEYSELLGGVRAWRQVSVGHIHGPANIAADHLSRGNILAFHTLCVNLGVRPRRLLIPLAARHYLHTFFERAAPYLPPELYALGRSPAAVAYDGPPVSYTHLTLPTIYSV